MWKPSLRRPFRSVCLALGRMHAFLNSLVYAELRKLWLPHLSLLQSFPFWAFLVCLLFVLSVVSCCRLLWPIPLPLDVFVRCYSGIHLSSGNAQNCMKQREAFAPVFDGSCQTGCTHNCNSLRVMSVLFPSNMHQGYGRLFSQMLSIWAVGVVGRLFKMPQCYNTASSPCLPLVVFKRLTISQSFSEVDSNSLLPARYFWGGIESWDSLLLCEFGD